LLYRELRAKLKLTEQDTALTLVGQESHFEIWPQQDWEKEKTGREQRAAHILDTLSAPK